VKPADLALVQGLDDTRATLRRWNAAPRAIVTTWTLWSLAIAVGLLYAVWVVAHAAHPDPTPLRLLGTGLDDVLHVVGRNALVLALHALACVAGFIAGSSLPLQAREQVGWRRTLYERAGPAAILFVAGATTFSLVTQAYVLGSAAATLCAQLQITPITLVATILPHALPELVALFLPLAAWLVASRARRWEELLAATFATCALAAPVLVIAATVEVYVWPELLRAASPLAI
jgi:stage II sporulation SpoM-like protein